MSWKEGTGASPDIKIGDVEFWKNGQGYFVYYLSEFIGSAYRVSSDYQHGYYRLALRQNLLRLGESVDEYHRTLDDLADEIMSFYIHRGL